MRPETSIKWKIRLWRWFGPPRQFPRTWWSEAEYDYLMGKARDGLIEIATAAKEHRFPVEGFVAVMIFPSLNARLMRLLAERPELAPKGAPAKINELIETWLRENGG